MKTRSTANKLHIKRRMSHKFGNAYTGHKFGNAYTGDFIIYMERNNPFNYIHIHNKQIYDYIYIMYMYGSEKKY